MKVKLSCI